ncbi:Translation initiation factor SUI1 family protein [Cryptosporidium felis]|nr:Translation initiation factor SUI1 family protein [Cryptosporidium felis]
MFRRKVPTISGESILGRRAIIQLRDKLVRQFSLDPQIGDLILGRRKKNDLKIVSTKFESSNSERGVIYWAEFEDDSSFYLGPNIAHNIESNISQDPDQGQLNIELNKTSRSDESDVKIETSSDKAIITRSCSNYSPNIPKISNFPVTLPWLFELNMGRLFPTMHLLWIHNSLFSIPKIYILKNAKSYIFNGADLMVGGVIIEASKEVTSIRKDQIWTINCIGEQFPIAIGVSLVDWDDISDPGSRKGKIIKVIHNCNDVLSSEGNMNFDLEMKASQEICEKENCDFDGIYPACEKLEALLTEKEQKLNSEMTALENQVEDIQISESKIGDSLNTASCSRDVEDYNSEYSKGELSRDLYDYLLESLLLKVVSEISENKALLPMDSSAFWDRITRLSQQDFGIQVDIRKSSFLKVQKFFQHYSKKNVLTIKQIRGTINIVDYSTTEISNLQKNHQSCDFKFRLPPVIKKKSNKSTSNTEKIIKSQEITPIEVIVLYQPDSNLQFILDYYNTTEGNSRLGEYYSVKSSRGERDQLFVSMSDIRNAMEFYLNSRELKIPDPSSPQNDKPTHVKLDFSLEKLFSKYLDSTSEDLKNVLPISLIFKELPKYLKTFHYIRGGQSLSSNSKPTIIKGECKTIQIHSESRMGTRKHVTIISPYISHFNLDPQLVAESCQKKFACSATTTQIKTYPSSNNVGIIIQGNVISQISDFLNSRWGVPKSYIQIS